MTLSEICATLVAVARAQMEATMIVLGIILIVLALIFPVIHILLWVGIALLVIGVVLLIAGATGHAVAGRKHYY